MGEPRRIELMPVSAPQNGKKEDKSTKTVRFQLSLTDSTSEACPEFSYAYLLQKRLEKRKNAAEEQTAIFDPDDPFSAQDAAEHDKLLSIAKSYEAKYGVVKPTKKGQQQRTHGFQEVVDLGDGYDDTDPFIDNTDAYDEIIPAELTTKLGGFYINSGHLDFRQVSGDEDEIRPTGLLKKRKKKRMITSDSENDDLRKKCRLKKKKSEFDMRFRRKKLSDRPLKKKRLIHVKGRGHPSSTHSCTSSPGASSSHMNGKQGSSSISDDNDSQSASSPKPVSLMTQDQYDSLFDSVIKSHSQDSGDDFSTAVKAPQVTEVEDERLTPEQAPALPRAISGNLAEVVSAIKQAAKEFDGKSKFFTPIVNKMLLRIELMSIKQLQSSERSTLYSHLAAYTPCGKQALVKRAKKLRLNQQDERLRAPIAKLKEAVRLAMPMMIEKHLQELQITEKAKQERKVEGRAKGEGSSDSEEEGGGGEEKLKRIMAPRKKFEWTEETRSLLCEVVKIRMDLYESVRSRTQSPEEYLRSFLDAEIRPLWPQGWMQTRMLFKESRSVHSKWTVEKVKVKKTALGPNIPAKPSILHPSPAALKAFAPAASLPSANGHVTETNPPPPPPLSPPAPLPPNKPEAAVSPLPRSLEEAISQMRAEPPRVNTSAKDREMYLDQFKDFVSAQCKMPKSVSEAWKSIGGPPKDTKPELLSLRRSPSPVQHNFIPSTAKTFADPQVTPVDWSSKVQSSSHHTQVIPKVQQQQQQPKLFQSSQQSHQMDRILRLKESSPSPPSDVPPPPSYASEMKSQASYGFPTTAEKPPRKNSFSSAEPPNKAAQFSPPTSASSYTNTVAHSNYPVVAHSNNAGTTKSFSPSHSSPPSYTDTPYLSKHSASTHPTPCSASRTTDSLVSAINDEILARTLIASQSSLAAALSSPSSVARSNPDVLSVAHSNPKPVARSNPQLSSVARSVPQPSPVARSNPQPSSVARSNPQPSSVARSNTPPFSPVARSNPQPPSIARNNVQSSVARSNPQPSSVARSKPPPISPVAHSNPQPSSQGRSNPPPISPVARSNPLSSPVARSNQQPLFSHSNPPSISPIAHSNPKPVARSNPQCSVARSNPPSNSSIVRNNPPSSVARSNPPSISPVAHSNSHSSVARSNPLSISSVAHSNPKPIARSNPQPSPVARSNPQPSPVARSNPQPSPVARSNPQPSPVAHSNPQPSPVARSNPQPSPVARSNPPPISPVAHSNAPHSSSSSAYANPMSSMNRVAPQTPTSSPSRSLSSTSPHEIQSLMQSASSSSQKSKKSFGGLSLEQIQAQAIAKAQKTHSHNTFAPSPHPYTNPKTSPSMWHPSESPTFTSPPNPKSVFPARHMQYPAAMKQRSPDTLMPGSPYLPPPPHTQSLGLQSPTSPLLHMPHSIMSSPGVIGTPPVTSNSANPFSLLSAYSDASSNPHR